MPIPADIRRRFYGVVWRTIVRPRILKRAGYRCERCGLANGAVGIRTNHGKLFHPVPVRRRRGAGAGHEIRIVLQVCHLDHTPGHDSDDNLQALCARCHFLLDAEQHRDTRAKRKDAARPLLTL